MKKIICLFVVGSIMLTSCSTQFNAEKRRYSKGFYIDAAKQKNAETSAAKNTQEGKSKAQFEKTAGSNYVLDNAHVDQLFTQAEEVSPETAPKVILNPYTASQTTNAVNKGKNLFEYERKIEQRKNEYMWISQEEGTNNTNAIMGIIFSSVGCVGSCLFSTAGIIFSAIAMKNIKEDPKKYGGKTMALWGLILGIVGFVGWMIVILYYLLLYSVY